MEILAPAGSIKALKYAVNCGADAVYFGIGEHNARIKSSDFDIKNLSKWVDYCHLYGVKAYITLNTLVKDSELNRIEELIKIIDNANADAIIAADIATIILATQIAPNLNIHISTQAGVHNALSAKFFKELGAKRIVVARESEHIADIKKNVDIEIEAFVHGAICVSMSGACLLSSIIGANSGNRGRCTQPCRKLYSAYDISGRFLKKGYLLSAADFAENIMDGVDSLKIEGRLKRPEYVGVVTDYYYKKLKGQKVDIVELEKIYNRGGFVKKYPRCAKLVYTHIPNHIGTNIGKITKVIDKAGYAFAEIQSIHDIKKGDGLKILRNKKECGGSNVTSVERYRGNFIVPVSKGVRQGDEVRLTTDSSQLLDISQVKKRLPLLFEFDLSLQKARFKVQYNDITIILENCDVSSGNLTDLQIFSQLSKLNDTPFFAKGITINNKSGYLPKSAINEMRRSAIAQLIDKVTSTYSRDKRVNSVSFDFLVRNKKYALGYQLIEINDISQAKIRGDNIIYIVNPINMGIQSFASFEQLGMYYIKIPRLNLNNEFDDVLKYAKEKGIGLLADNVYIVKYARENNIKYIAGMGLNITNSIAFDYYCDAEHIVLSPEITSAQLCKRGGVVFALGHLPLMTLAHCPITVVYGEDSCRHKGEIINYKSEGHNYYLVPTIGKKCQYTLYNGVVYNLLSKVQPMGYNIYINMLNYCSIDELRSCAKSLSIQMDMK